MSFPWGCCVGGSCLNGCELFVFFYIIYCLGNHAFNPSPFHPHPPFFSLSSRRYCGYAHSQSHIKAAALGRQRLTEEISDFEAGRGSGSRLYGNTDAAPATSTAAGAEDFGVCLWACCVCLMGVFFISSWDGVVPRQRTPPPNPSVSPLSSHPVRVLVW